MSKSRLNNAASPVFMHTVVSVIIIQGASAGLLFATGFLIARAVGQAAFGAYDYADVWVETLVLFAMLGFDRMLIRLVAGYNADKQWNWLHGLLKYSFLRILLAAILLAVLAGLLITVIFLFIDHRTDSSLVVATFWIAMILLPLRAGLKFNQVVMQGMNRVAFGYLPDYVLRPALLILAIPFLITDPISAMGAHVSAAVIALAVSFVLFWRVLPPELFDTQAQVDHSWLPGAFPFMLISGFSLINIRGGTALVGMISDMETVALYGASVRVGGLIALTLAAVSAVAAPRIAALFASGDMDSLQRLVARSARGITVIAVPVAAFLIVFGRRVLTLYGPGFVEAHPALIVISLGQIINAATGVVGWVMIMTGHEWAMAKILIATVLAHLVLIGILTPFFGVTGAAVATAFANVLLNISLAVYSISRIGINPTILPFKLSRS